jgi:hypothetical protein
MLSKCLNSHCSATFRYLGQGRLFRIDFAEERRMRAHAGGKMFASTGGRASPIEYFWLCESCAATMTIEVHEDGRVHVVPRQIPAKKPAASVAPPMPRLVANAS